MKDHVYITPHLHYAQIYGIGADMAGNENAQKYAKGEHAYVFEIHGKHLNDIHPDEDSVGEKATDEIKTKWNSETRKFQPDPANKHPQLGDMARNHATSNQLRNLKDGYIDAQARVGKKLNKVMPDYMKYNLIDDGSHIAHKGELEVSKAWRVHKSKFHLLKKDGSNFFDHAEEVPIKKNVTESIKNFVTEAWKLGQGETRMHGKYNHASHSTKIDGHDVFIEINGKPNSTHNVNFSVNGSYDHARLPKETGKKILHHVSNKVSQFVRHAKPNGLVFSSQYDSRINLQKKFADRLAKKHNGTVTQHDGVNLTHTTVTFKKPMNESIKQFLTEDDEITIHRGQSSNNKKGGPMGGRFFSTDKEWSRQFTQSGRDNEIISHKISKSHIMDKSHVYAGDDIEPHLKEAKLKGFKAVRFNEGNGEPHSIYVFDKKALK